MSSKRPALGRGLSSLLAIEPADKRDSVLGKKEGLVKLPLASITTNPFQPRLDFDSGAITELAKSIETQGLLQPVVVREVTDGTYEIISGERRFRAMSQLAWETIPVLIRDDVDDTKMLELALVENIQRENLNNIEMALSYQKLLETCGLSHDELSVQVGKSRSSITNILRLLKLPEDIQGLVRRDALSMGHARALLGCEAVSEQRDLAKLVVTKGLSVRDIEKKVAGLKKIDEPTKPARNVLLENIGNQVVAITGITTMVKGSEKKGSFVLKYKNKSEFDKIQMILLGTSHE